LEKKNTLVLFFLSWAVLACLFINNNKQKSDIFSKRKGPSTPKVKEMHIHTSSISTLFSNKNKK